MDLLSQELREVETLIELHERKRGLLEKMRTALLAGEPVALPAAYRRLLQDKVPLLAEISFDDAHAPSRSAEDHMIERAAIQANFTVDFIRFIPVRSARPPTAGPKTDTTPGGVPTSLLVCVSREGHVGVYIHGGELTAYTQMEPSQPIRHVAVSTSIEDQHLVALGEGGEVLVYAIRIRHIKLSREEKKGRKSSHDERISLSMGPMLNVTLKFDVKGEWPPSVSDGLRNSTALACYQNRGVRYIVIGDREGGVSVLMRNTTFKGRVRVTEEEGGVTGLAGHTNTLFFRTHTMFGPFSPAMLDSNAPPCNPGLSSPIHDMVLDVTHPSRPIVSLEDGSVLAFETKGKACLVEFKYPQVSSRPLQLFAMRGYTLAFAQPDTTSASATTAQPASLIAFNTSAAESRSGAHGVTFRKTIRQQVLNFVGFRKPGQIDVVAMQTNATSVVVYEVVLTPPPPQTDLSPWFTNLRIPILLIAVVAVFVFQYFKVQNQRTSTRMKHDSRFDRDQMEELLSRTASYSSASRRGRLGGGQHRQYQQRGQHYYDDEPQETMGGVMGGGEESGHNEFERELRARHHVHRDDGGGGLGVGMGAGIGGRHTSDTVYGSEHEAYD
ncbi:unnamed protein product [Vitrella brassicaformis CCMP3155]|uniref:Uncharacterized protein n=1 Tax=Vitrella brassicaformis (strain CCMP3155) TaxID=1169540 RepID=A0A0G4GC61_VITBC|nr:unnamed protein product [Vitrella brassicaformis CCMP3155]|eukprot:CEM26555.1 unnamed protein product [Vitrella brassicaformis CCMP3155]